MARGKSREGGRATGRTAGKKKLFFKIKDVCELTSTEPYVLRYWEQEFPFLAPEKNKAGHRIYNEEDIELVRRIKKLLYDEGYTTAGARRQLERERAGEDGGASDGAPAASPATESSGEMEELKAENERLRERVGRLEGDRDRLASSLRALRDHARDLRELVQAGSSGAGGGGVTVRRSSAGSAKKKTAAPAKKAGGAAKKKAAGAKKKAAGKAKPKATRKKARPKR